MCVAGVGGGKGQEASYFLKDIKVHRVNFRQMGF